MCSVSGFVDRVACLVRGEVAAHSEMVTDIVSSAPDSFERDLQSILETLQTDKRGS